MKETNFESFYLCKAAGLYSVYNVGCHDKPYVKPLQINASGAMIYEELEAGKTIEEISEEIASSYGIDKAAVLGDVKSFAVQLINYGLQLTLE